MSTLNKFTKVEADSGVRCQVIIPQGQCQYEQVVGSEFCIMHGGIHAVRSQKAKEIRNYRFQKYKERIDELADNSGIKSLREEIGVLRVLLEQTVNRCKSDTDLLLYSSKISDLALKIEKLVTSCHRIESSLGFMMDKVTVLNISTQIVNILSTHVTQQEVLDVVISEITNLIETS